VKCFGAGEKEPLILPMYTSEAFEHLKCNIVSVKFYVFLTVHLDIFVQKNQLVTLFILNILRQSTSIYVEIKCQLDATEGFIADLIACSTCFGHHCADHQELKSII